MKAHEAEVSRPKIDALRRTWRKVTPKEHESYSNALDAQFGKDRPRLKPGPKPNPEGRYVSTHIKFHPIALAWAKRMALKRRLRYQTFINQVLMDQSKGSRNRSGSSHRPSGGYIYVLDKQNKVGRRGLSKRHSATP